MDMQTTTLTERMKEIKEQIVKFNNYGGYSEMDYIANELPYTCELTLVFKAFEDLVSMVDCYPYHTIACNIVYMRLGKFNY